MCSYRIVGNNYIGRGKKVYNSRGSMAMIKQLPRFSFFLKHLFLLALKNSHGEACQTI